jgi:endonuclease YncB( thermonuclease family)
MTERTIVEEYTWVVPFTVTRLKDADTFVGTAMLPGHVEIKILNMVADMNFPVEQVIRLEGVNAPENNTQAGKAATAYVAGWISDHQGQPLYLATNMKRDSFGRLLGDIRLSPSYLTGLANDLLQSGHAEPYTRHGSW